MPYQIQSKQTLQSPGKRWTQTELLSVGGWTITLATKDEADVIAFVLSPSEPYILQPHQFDAPSIKAVEGGSVSGSKTIGEVIELLGMSAYYNPDGTRKTDAEIYGEEDAEWRARGRCRA